MSLPIALDYRSALLSPAGIGRATRELARHLADRDDLQVHLFAHSLARARVAIDTRANTHLHRWPIPGRSLPFLQRLGLGADRLAGRPRVFHWLDFVYAPLSHARSVLTVHDLAFFRDADWHGANAEILRVRTQRAIATADAIVVPSAATATDLGRFCPTARNVHIVPFGADHVPTRDLSSHPLAGRPYMLCVGTIEPRKNHRTLLAAFRRLPAPRPLLVVIGKQGWQCADIVADLHAAVAQGDAVWRQDCADEQLWQWLRHARLLVYPSKWEGFGFPPIEAMQMGVPVLANDIAPLHEVGDDAIVYVDANDSAALADALHRLLTDAALHARLIELGRKRAASFKWRHCALAHAAIYREVAS